MENNFYKPTALKSPLKTCQLPNPKSLWLHLKQQLLVTDGLIDANINSIDTEADIWLNQYQQNKIYTLF